MLATTHLCGPAWRRVAMRLRPGQPFGWASLALLAAVELVWMAHDNVSVSGWSGPCIGIAACAGLACLTRQVTTRPQFAEMTEAFALWISLCALGCVLTYLCARTDTALWDQEFIALDRSVGFDWLAWQHWVDTRPHVQWLLRCAYASLLMQIIFCCCLLPFHPDRRRGIELYWTVLVALLVTSLLARLFPALSAFVAFGLSERAGWLPDLVALRGSLPMRVAFSQMHGIVTFPSFHTVLATLIIYAHRRSGLVTAAVAGLNVVMIISTLSEGGHYLSDVIAGLAVAVLSIVVVRTVMLYRSAERTASYTSRRVR